MGSTRDEIALLRNATEANNYIANGVDLKAGDEVLMTDQEHPGGEQPWQLPRQALRHRGQEGDPPQAGRERGPSPQPLPRRHHARTRVLFFSHISTITGVVLPAKELCALARSKGILSAVDAPTFPA